MEKAEKPRLDSLSAELECWPQPATLREFYNEFSQRFDGAHVSPKDILNPPIIADIEKWVECVWPHKWAVRWDPSTRLAALCWVGPLAEMPNEWDSPCPPGLH